MQVEGETDLRASNLGRVFGCAGGDAIPGNVRAPAAAVRAARARVGPRCRKRTRRGSAPEPGDREILPGPPTDSDGPPIPIPPRASADRPRAADPQTSRHSGGRGPIGRRCRVPGRFVSAKCCKGAGVGRGGGFRSEANGLRVVRPSVRRSCDRNSGSDGPERALKRQLVCVCLGAAAWAVVVEERVKFGVRERVLPRACSQCRQIIWPFRRGTILG
mmetsp:Transcript_47363/g.99115  ORF Transcript_47363/g.99115 Transcript_47363/m.99115 type:complete len:217 (-) Transcript_47363:269-919(-)